MVVVGNDFASGMRHQLLIPGGAWHVSRVRAGGSYALMGTTERPGFDAQRPPDRGRARARAGYPDLRAQIGVFTGSV